jgi:erythromycin esterase-like protein
MGSRGELNVGQLTRQRHGRDCLLVGFSSYDGRVTAASNWGEAPQRKLVRPALAGSYEELFHSVGVERFWLPTADAAFRAALHEPRLQRAIGVIYRPETERQSHYFLSDLPRQFDWMLHYDRTTALEPLDPPHAWHSEEPPDTYPSGL